MGGGERYWQFDMGEPKKASALSYWPYGSWSGATTYYIGTLRVETSDDGENWLNHGVVSLGAPTPEQWIYIYFYEPVTARYFRVTPLTSQSGSSSSIYAREVGIYK